MTSPSIPARPSVEQVVAALHGHGDVRHEREARKPLLELADPLEVRLLFPVQVDDGHAHRLAVAGPGERRPILAFAQLVPVPDRGPEPLHVQRLRKKCRYDSHGRR